MAKSEMDIKINVDDKELRKAIKRTDSLINDLNNPNRKLNVIMKWVLVFGLISVMIEGIILLIVLYNG